MLLSLGFVARLTSLYRMFSAGRSGTVVLAWHSTALLTGFICTILLPSLGLSLPAIPGASV